MTSTKQRRMSPLFLTLAGISLALASWGYFRLFVDFAGMPEWLAAFAVGGLDLAAVLIGKHALDVAEDGDSSAPWNVALIMLVGLGAFAQFSHAMLAGDPLAIGIVSAAFPVVTVLLFEGQLRRLYRLKGRAAGRLAAPRATIDLITWLFFTRLAVRATKLSVLDRGLDAESALAVAEAQLRTEDEEAARPKVRRTMRRTYAKELGSGQFVEIESGQQTDRRIHRPPSPDDNGGRSADQTDESADEQELPADIRRRGDLAKAVDDALRIAGNDPEKVIEIVRFKYPDVLADNVRRTLARRVG